MRTRFILGLFFVAICFSCSKKKIAGGEGAPDFTFRLKKNGVFWEVNNARGYYHPKDSMLYVVAEGDHQEQLNLNFKRIPRFTGRMESFSAGVSIPVCMYCAGVAALYNPDSSKINRLDIVGFDDLEGRILGKISINFKKKKIYEGPFEEESNIFEGVFSVPYEEVIVP